MKILLIVPEFPPHHIGGGGVVFESLAKNYQKMWHDVLVIAGDYTKKNIFQKLEITDENGVKIVRIPELFTPISVLNSVMPYPFWYNFFVKKIIRDFSPDFVHLHGYGLFMPAQMAKILKKMQIPYTFTIHGAPTSPDKMGNIIIKMAYNFYHKFYGFPLLNGAKNLTAVSEFAKNFAIFEKYREKITVIGNGIVVEDYEKISPKNPYEAYFQKNEKTRIILSVGRLEWWKGFDRIIEILPKMKKAGYDVKYVILWRDNGEKEKWENLAKTLGVAENIFFVGFVIGDEKNAFFENADVIAVPSIEGETFWIVALEARFFQKNVLTTFFGGLKEALSGYKNAYALDEWEKALTEGFSGDAGISEFYYEKICQKYLQTR